MGKLESAALNYARGRHGRFWLAAVAFAEASFFIVPPDLILIAIVLAGGGWIRHAIITTVFSVLGGAAGYLLGWGLFDLVGRRVVEFYGLAETVSEVAGFFSGNAFLAIFVSAFTPIPYKVFTIAAGLFKINFAVFLVASLLGRGLRFFAVAYLTRLLGPKLNRRGYHYFNLLTLLVTILVILLFFSLI